MALEFATILRKLCAHCCLVKARGGTCVGLLMLGVHAISQAGVFIDLCELAGNICTHDVAKTIGPKVIWKVTGVIAMLCKEFFRCT